MPRGFPQYVVEDIDRELAGGKTGLVVFRLPLLGEMLRLSLRRGDSVATRCIVEALSDARASYIARVAERPGLAEHRTEDGQRRGWFVDDHVSMLVNAADDGLTLGIPSFDLNLFARSLSGLAAELIEAGQYEDLPDIIDGLVSQGTTTQQVGQGYINHFSEPIGQLAFLEEKAERAGQTDVAAYALAGWALTQTYPRFHLELDRYAMWDRSIEAMGPHPPWEGAERCIRSQDWQWKWANKQYLGPDPVVVAIADAKQAHRRR
ncbi:hypothetical protein LRS13_15885 [Svornostia abyssi]|uniref:Uncharacterized protein n=1 Tax=Svornostia abyssi TaxID=2898438 RepID=A0ABY5PBZ7_9ACTN|nr:hypothetical protein LRS13_15885 [Parviterribacteraceae bacterium J379]